MIPFIGVRVEDGTFKSPINETYLTTFVQCNQLTFVHSDSIEEVGWSISRQEAQGIVPTLQKQLVTKPPALATTLQFRKYHLVVGSALSHNGLALSVYINERQDHLRINLAADDVDRFIGLIASFFYLD